MIMGRLDNLYDESIMIKRPMKGTRIGSIGKMIVNKVGEEIVKKIPDSSDVGILGGVYKSAKNGLRETLQAKKHKYGKDAFENPIPGLNKIVQNGWSLYHLKDGLTTMDSVYTVERGGAEYMIYMQEDGESLSTADLSYMADKVKGKEAEVEMSLYNSLEKFKDDDSVEAGVYEELTDNDAKQTMDKNRVPSEYRQAELWLFGKKGKRTVIGTASDGSKIIRYEKPSTADFLKYYGRMDLMYSALSMTAAPAEGILSNQAKENLYVSEAVNSIESTKRAYGGGANPLAPHSIYRNVA